VSVSLYVCPLAYITHDMSTLHVIMATLWNRAGHYIFALWFLSFFFLSSFFCFPRLISAVADWMSTILLHIVWPYSANLEFRSEMCCTRLAGNSGSKKSPKIRHLGTIINVCRAMSSQLRHVSIIGKNLLNSNSASTCPHNMTKFGPLGAEIISLVWGTPANFDGCRVLVSLLQRSRSTEANETLHDSWPSSGLVHYIFGGS